MIVAGEISIPAAEGQAPNEDHRDASVRARDDLKEQVACSRLARSADLVGRAAQRAAEPSAAPDRFATASIASAIRGYRATGRSWPMPGISISSAPRIF